MVSVTSFVTLTIQYRDTHSIAIFYSCRDISIDDVDKLRPYRGSTDPTEISQLRCSGYSIMRWGPGGVGGGGGGGGEEEWWDLSAEPPRGGCGREQPSHIARGYEWESLQRSPIPLRLVAVIVRSWIPLCV